MRFRSTLDRILGTDATSGKILRDLHVSIARQRRDDTTRTLFRSYAGGSAVGVMFRQMRTAAAKSGTRKV